MRRKKSSRKQRKKWRERKRRARTGMFGDWEHQEYYEKLLDKGLHWTKARELTKKKFPMYDPDGYEA